jgi:stearoyl-CoA desaturase (delta-9 desaturase)
MKTKAWHRSVGSWLFLPVLYFVLTSTADPLWLVPSFLIYLSIALTVTVGYHRLFVHNSFDCSRFWHWTFGLIGCISLSSAPVHWSTVHITHHKFTDTDEDPYDSNWRHFFRFKDRDNVKATKNEVRMMRDSMHLFFINHSLTLSIATGVILASLSTTAFLFLFALPVTLYLITSGLHTIFAHSSQNNEGSIHGARNLWLLEFIIPMGGEWIHKEHHDKPKLNDWHTKPHYFDLGGMMIRLIERNAQQTT